MPRVFLSVSRWCHIGNLQLINDGLKMRTNVGMLGRYGAWRVVFGKQTDSSTVGSTCIVGRIGLLHM